MKVADLVEAMEGIAPVAFAAPWDNVGLLVGDDAAPLERVVLAIDCTPSVVDEAVAMRASAVVSYHPPIFAPAKRFVAGSSAYALARAGIAVYSPHTALDVAAGGTNDVLADAIAMSDRRALRPLSGRAAGTQGPGETSPSLGQATGGANATEGFGRVGQVGPLSLRALVERLKASIGASHVLVAGSLDAEISRAAVCAGAAGELLDDAIAARAGVLVTGELRHHDALRALAAGVSVVAALHSVSERCALGPLEHRLAACLPGVVFVRSASDRDPFAFA